MGHATNISNEGKMLHINNLVAKVFFIFAGINYLNDTTENKMKITAKYVAAMPDQEQASAQNPNWMLYPYQIAAARAMRQMETPSRSMQPRFSALLDRSNSCAARQETLMHVAPLTKGFQRQQTGLLVAPTGSGKTLIVIELLNMSDHAPPKKSIVRQSCLGSIHMDTIHLDLDMVVVPIAIFQQWVHHVKMLACAPEAWYTIEKSSELNAFVNSIETDGEEHEGIEHVIITSTMYQKMLVYNCKNKKAATESDNERAGESSESSESEDEVIDLDGAKRKFTGYHVPKQINTSMPQPPAKKKQKIDFEAESGGIAFSSKYRVRRVIVDEADSTNHHMLWADFIWVISATFALYMRRLTATGGFKKSKASLIGELKIGAYQYTEEQINELMSIDIDPELIKVTLAHKLLPYQGVSSFFELPDPPAYAAPDDIKDVDDWANIVPFIVKTISTRTPEYARIVILYSDSGHMAERPEMEVLYTGLAEAIVKPDTLVSAQNNRQYKSHKVVAAIDEAHELAQKSSTARGRKIFLVNTRFLAAGVNLQFATHAFIVGSMSESRIVQSLGRVQRPVRTTVLQVFRLWAPPNLLKSPLLKGAYIDMYEDIKKKMKGPWTIEIEKAVSRDISIARSEASETLANTIRNLRRTEKRQQAAALATELEPAGQLQYDFSVVV